MEFTVEMDVGLKTYHNPIYLKWRLAIITAHPKWVSHVSRVEMKNLNPKMISRAHSRITTTQQYVTTDKRVPWATWSASTETQSTPQGSRLWHDMWAIQPATGCTSEWRMESRVIANQQKRFDHTIKGTHVAPRTTGLNFGPGVDERRKLTSVSTL